MPERLAVSACVGLGANLGDARHGVHQALHDLGRVPGVKLVARSGLFRSAPLEASGPEFVNAVARIDTTLTAPQLLSALQQLEAAAGRLRPYPNAPRTLDLDLLLYGHSSIASQWLTVPHPRMWQRAFVLQPLAQVWPQRVPQSLLLAVANQDVSLLDAASDPLL